MSSNNPTALSAVVGQKLGFGGGGGLGELIRMLLMPVVLAAFATYLVVGMVTMDVPEGAAFPGPQFFPALIAAGLYACAVLLPVQAVRARRRLEAAAGGSDPTTAEADEALLPREVRVDWRSLAWVVGSFLAFALLLDVLGWILAAALMFVGITRGFASRSWLRSLIVGLAVSSVAYIAFDMGLGLSLPSGILGWDF